MIVVISILAIICLIGMGFVGVFSFYLFQREHELRLEYKILDEILQEREASVGRMATLAKMGEEYSKAYKEHEAIYGKALPPEDPNEW